MDSGWTPLHLHMFPFVEIRTGWSFGEMHWSCRKNLGQLSSLVIAGWWESWISLLLCEWWRNYCAFFRTGSAWLFVLRVSKAWFLSFCVRCFKQPILPMWSRHNRPTSSRKEVYHCFCGQKTSNSWNLTSKVQMHSLGFLLTWRIHAFVFEYTSE